MSGFHASYLGAIFDRKAQDKAIREMKALIKDIEYDGFVVIGVSGITMGAIMARSCRKRLIIIRKNDNTHSGHTVENFDSGSYIFLDDLIASGLTFKRVKKALREAHQRFSWIGKKAPKIIGKLLYCDDATYTKL